MTTATNTNTRMNLPMLGTHDEFYVYHQYANEGEIWTQQFAEEYIAYINDEGPRIAEENGGLMDEDRVMYKVALLVSKWDLSPKDSARLEWDEDPTGQTFTVCLASMVAKTHGKPDPIRRTNLWNDYFANDCTDY